MATTRPLSQPLPRDWVESKMYSLGASQTVPFGTLACNDGGVVKALTSTLCQAGATLLGIALEDYANTTVSAVTKTMVFARRLSIVLPKQKTGDTVAAADVGATIALEDNETIKKTVAGTDATCVLLEILPGGAGYRVLI